MCCGAPDGTATLNCSAYDLNVPGDRIAVSHQVLELAAASLAQAFETGYAAKFDGEVVPDTVVRLAVMEVVVAEDEVIDLELRQSLALVCAARHDVGARPRLSLQPGKDAFAHAARQVHLALDQHLGDRPEATLLVPW